MRDLDPYREQLALARRAAGVLVEVRAVHRYSVRPCAPAEHAFMCFTGLVPTEDSSGLRERRGKITKAGNVHVRTQLVESAWAYQYRPAVGVILQRRQAGAPPATITRSWTAQQRLTTRFRRMRAQRHHDNVVATAVARELSGFLWAEMTH